MTLGCIFVAEVLVLTVWGLLTPGKIIATEQAVLVLGGTALLVALASAAAYKIIFPRTSKGSPAAPSSVGFSMMTSDPAARTKPTSSLRGASLWQSGTFVLVLGVSVYFIGGTFDAFAQLMSLGATNAVLINLVTSLLGVSVAAVASAYLLYRLDLGSGMIKRRVRAFEVGWRGQE